MASELKVSEFHAPCVNDHHKAPLFVLLHGFGASIFSWRSLTQPLSELGEVFAYDRPGFGDTERPTKWQGTNPYSIAWQLEYLEKNIKKLRGERPVILVGHSAGGQIATYFAALHTELISGLVLISPALKAAGAPKIITKLLDQKAFDRVGPKMARAMDKAGMQLLYKSVHDLAFLTPEAIAGYRSPLRHSDWTVGFWQFLKTPQPRNQKKVISQVTCPTLVLTGDDDRVIPTKDTLKNAPKYQNHRLIVIPEAGHISHEEKPEIFMAAVRANLPWLLGE